MKKLTKKNLEELAKEMPVISEIEQRSMVGGTIYVDYDGFELGRVGGSDLFYVIGTKDMYYHARDNDIQDYGKPLSLTSKESLITGSGAYSGKDPQKSVFSYYAEITIGYTGPVYVVQDYNNSEDIRFEAEGGMTSGGLYFNTLYSGSIFTENGLRQRLFEKRSEIHNPGGTGSLPGGTGNISDEERIQMEINNIMFEVQELNKQYPYVNKTNNPILYEQLQNRRWSLAHSLISLWIQQGNEGVGYQITDAYRICGVEGYN